MSTQTLTPQAIEDLSLPALPGRHRAPYSGRSANKDILTICYGTHRQLPRVGLEDARCCRCGVAETAQRRPPIMVGLGMACADCHAAFERWVALHPDAPLSAFLAPRHRADDEPALAVAA
ncbi:hypothetical protein [Georgenia faecalis]|uniref:hypothetical protein n=1 Tax=Georgenia faecalis TaxID=2483799 RepID=UPI000FD86CA8|nr:hypothetical protein [Georgenia faecalis]